MSIIPAFRHPGIWVVAVSADADIEALGIIAGSQPLPLARMGTDFLARNRQIRRVERTPLMSPVVIDVHADALRVRRQLDPAVLVHIFLGGGVCSIVVQSRVANHIIPGLDVPKGLLAIDLAQADETVEFRIELFEACRAEAGFTFITALDGEGVVDELPACRPVTFGIDQNFVAIGPEFFEDAFDVVVGPAILVLSVVIVGQYD